MKLLYIISQRRSGSTLIENLLGQHQQVISVGEFRMLHGHYLKQGPGSIWDWKCNCGVHIEDCKFWSNYYQLVNNENLKNETALKYKISFWQWIQVLFGNINSIVKKNNIQGKRISHFTLDVYNNIKKDFPGKQIVDSSKDSLQGYYLTQNSEDVIILYLKRQLRATASSKYKRALMKGQTVSLIKMLILSFLTEIFNNRIVRLISEERVFSFSYEEFIKKKELIYRQILTVTNLPEKPIPEFFQPYPSHSIGGTPNRFKKSPITYDDSWKQLYHKHPFANYLGILLEKLLGK